MRPRLAITFLMIGATAIVGASPSSDASRDTHAGTRGHVGRLIWSAEFNGPRGERPDAGKWGFQTGYGWGDGELQAYTSRPANVTLDGKGHLAIIARPEQYTDRYGQTASYTSARLTTERRFEFAYGRVSARIKVPAGRGLLSGFWGVGSDLSSVGWPASGEIDVMEVHGDDPYTLHGVLHGPRQGHQYSTVEALRRSPAPLSDRFHVYRVAWSPRRVAFSMDGGTYAVQTRASLPSDSRWSFDHPFSLLLTLAVGPRWMAPPDATTPWPARMLVDWVRVRAFRTTFCPTVRARNVRPRCPRRPPNVKRPAPGAQP